MRIYVPYTKNLGDMFNVMPVISGLSKSLGVMIDLVVSDNLLVVKGFRDFMEFQPCINTLRFRKEILGMDESSYLHIIYSQEEFRHLTERPNRPIETMRHEKFVRDNYPTLEFEVDDDFVFNVKPEYHFIPDFTPDMYIVGDRWMNDQTDMRRSSNIIRDGLPRLWHDKETYYFLEYTETLMHNAYLISVSKKPFIGTFTGSGMLADLLGVKNYCVWDNSMINWNNAPIEYSYHKHYYADRLNQLVHISDLPSVLSL